MTETHSPEQHGSHSIKPYLVIFGALVVFTAISFVVNAALGRNYTSFVIILGVAICKAVLVGLFFMHLKLDWGRLYFMIVPVMVLGALLVVVLLPDIVLAWHH